MEGRLDYFIKGRDYYSAHQLLLSQAQRLERAGRVGESRRFLLCGIEKLGTATPPAATLFDVIKKYMSLSEDLGMSEVDVSSEVLEVLAMVLETKDVPDNLKNFWKEVAAFAIQNANNDDGTKVAVLLLKAASLSIEDATNFCLRHCAEEQEIFSLVGEVVSVELFLRTSLELLRLRCFYSCVKLVEAFTQKSHIDTRTIKQVQLSEEDSVEACAINLITLLGELLRRESPPRDSFVQLQLRYSKRLISTDEHLKGQWNELRESVWPPKLPSHNSTNNHNPLAAMLQSLMMNNQ